MPSNSPAETPSGTRPDDSELARRVIAVIAETQGVTSDSLSLDSTFEELGFDSLDGFQILFALEEELDVEIPDDEARRVASVRDVVESLRPLVAMGTAGAVPPPEPAE